MNSESSKNGNKNKTLMIVEGEYEEKFFELIFKCFPEMNINEERIICVYKSNIYNFLETIKEKFGIRKEIGFKELNEKLNEELQDIDLSIVLEKELSNQGVDVNNTHFTNIFLIFDYERHHTYFNNETISIMQNTFSNETDNGKLYINYPMIESYMNFKSFPSKNYVSDQYYEDEIIFIDECLKYKEKFKQNTDFNKFFYDKFNFLDDLKKQLSKRFEIDDKNLNEIVDGFCNISNEEDLKEYISSNFNQKICENKRKQALNYIPKIVERSGYIKNKKTYYNYIKSIIKKIIYYNVCKSNKILNDRYSIDEYEYESVFKNLDYDKILEIQNNSCLHKNYMCILNTCLFLIPSYNFNLVMLDKEDENLVF